MSRSKKPKGPLTRERVLAAAVAMADKSGLESLSMRKLGQKLGVEAMSLYNHVANKDDLFDALVEVAVGEIDLPNKGEPWKVAMRRRAISARAVFIRHPWAIGLMESRKSPGEASMRYYDAVIGCLREAGFTIAMAAHAFSVLDSYIFGFALQEVKMPFDSSEELADMAEEIMSEMPAEEFPHFTEMIVKHALQPGYDYADEFDFGLELILDGLQRAKKKQ